MKRNISMKSVITTVRASRFVDQNSIAASLSLHESLDLTMLVGHTKDYGVICLPIDHYQGLSKCLLVGQFYKIGGA